MTTPTTTLAWHWDGSTVRLEGRIDENADLERLGSEAPAGAVTIDLSALTRINSIGVREWMDFLRSLGARRIRLQRCAPVFVDQLNAIANFSATAELVSVLAEYECDVDGSGTLVEVQTVDARAGRWPPPPPCSQCGAPTRFAAEDVSYYRFLRYVKAPG